MQNTTEQFKSKYFGSFKPKKTNSFTLFNWSLVTITELKMVRLYSYLKWDMKSQKWRTTICARSSVMKIDSMIGSFQDEWLFISLQLSLQELLWHVFEVIFHQSLFKTAKGTESLLVFIIRLHFIGTVFPFYVV